MPPEGKPLKVLEIRHIAYEESHLDAVSDLLRFTFRRFWPEFRIFRIGLHEKDPLIKILKRLPRVGVDLLLLAAFRKEDP